MKLPLPPWMGRNMKGVLDETGLLQYGEVFVQYSPVRMRLLMVMARIPSMQIISQPSNPIQPYTGKVLISKNPMMVGGDVRLFNAVHKEVRFCAGETALVPLRNSARSQVTCKIPQKYQRR